MSLTPDLEALYRSAHEPDPDGHAPVASWEHLDSAIAYLFGCAPDAPDGMAQTLTLDLDPDVLEGR